MNIFERAARAKLRFPSAVGDLTTEQLFDLPLQAKGGRPDLDTVARDAYLELKEIGEISFVADTQADPKKANAELRLELVKHVIQSKKDAAAAATKTAENRQRKAKLLAALASKEESEFQSMSKEDIEKEIAALGGG